MTSAGSLSSRHTRIAIFAATSWEIDAVRTAFPSGTTQYLDGFTVEIYTINHREYWLIRTGIGHIRAQARAAQVLHAQSFHLVVSTGFACALVAARIGDLLISQEVLHLSGVGAQPSQRLEMPGSECESVVTFGEGLVPSARQGLFVSTNHIIGRASDKAWFAKNTQAIGLDMESAALATEAQRAGVPFIIIRSVSDLMDEDLPVDFNLFLSPTDWLKGIGAIVMAPSCLLGIGRLRRQSRAAGATLTDFFRSYTAAMVADQHQRELSPSLS